MTTIAGVVHRGRVYLAGDSAVTGECGDVYITSTPKVWRVNAALAIGICGASEWEIALAKFRTRATDDAAIAELERHALACAREEDDSDALIAYGGKLWVLESCGAIWPLADRESATGSGGDVARGVLWATRGRAPRARLRTALAAAAALTSETRPPWRFVYV